MRTAGGYTAVTRFVFDAFRVFLEGARVRVFFRVSKLYSPRAVDDVFSSPLLFSPLFIAMGRERMVPLSRSTRAPHCLVLSPTPSTLRGGNT